MNEDSYPGIPQGLSELESWIINNVYSFKCKSGSLTERIELLSKDLGIETRPEFYSREEKLKYLRDLERKYIYLVREDFRR